MGNLIKGGSSYSILFLLFGINGCASAGNSDPPPPQDLAIPCEPARVLHDVCQQCHSNPPVNQAPFPLVTYSDVHAIVAGKPNYQNMLEAIQAGNMPASGVPISDADKQVLINWLQAGAPDNGDAGTCQ